MSFPRICNIAGMDEITGMKLLFSKVIKEISTFYNFVEKFIISIGYVPKCSLFGNFEKFTGCSDTKNELLTKFLKGFLKV